jgi:hydrogenase expression/formation protein HypC
MRNKTLSGGGFMPIISASQTTLPCTSGIPAMCLSIPMQIISRDGDRAIAETLGVRREIGLSLLGEPAPQPGDYVVVHVGYAIERLEPDAALESLALWQAMQEHGSNA